MLITLRYGGVNLRAYKVQLDDGDTLGDVPHGLSTVPIVTWIPRGQGPTLGAWFISTIDASIVRIEKSAGPGTGGTVLLTCSVLGARPG